MKAEHRQALLWLAAAIVFFLAICITMRATGQEAPVPPVIHVTNVWYFAATATASNGLTSDYSNEVAWTNADCRTVRLAWDPSPTKTNYDAVTGEEIIPVVTNYTVYAGYNTAVYSYHTNAGTNLTVVLPIPIPPHPIDQVITVGASNAPSITMTNPQRTLYFRSHSWKVGKQWPTELQCAEGPSGPWSVLVGPVTNREQPRVSLCVSRESFPREE